MVDYLITGIKLNKKAIFPVFFMSWNSINSQTAEKNTSIQCI